MVVAATENPFKSILKTLQKPGGGGEFGQYYSLPALNDPRIGESLTFSIFTDFAETIFCIFGGNKYHLVLLLLLLLLLDDCLIRY